MEYSSPDFTSTFDRRRKSYQCYKNLSDHLHTTAGASWLAHTGKIASELEGLEIPSGQGQFIYYTYCMQCGLSIELLLKSILCRMGEEIPETHNLSSLLSKIGKKGLNKGDIALLDYLYACIDWSGKYPTPKENREDKFDKFHSLIDKLFTKPIETNSDLKISKTTRLSWDDYKKLREKVLNIYLSLPQ